MITLPTFHCFVFPFFCGQQGNNDTKPKWRSGIRHSDLQPGQHLISKWGSLEACTDMKRCLQPFSDVQFPHPLYSQHLAAAAKFAPQCHFSLTSTLFPASSCICKAPWHFCPLCSCFIFLLPSILFSATNQAMLHFLPKDLLIRKAEQYLLRTKNIPFCRPASLFTSLYPQLADVELPGILLIDTYKMFLAMPVSFRWGMMILLCVLSATSQSTYAETGEVKSEVLFFSKSAEQNSL